MEVQEMANLTLDISIRKSDFPEIGTPYLPNDSKDIAKAKSLNGFRADARKEYENFANASSRAFGDIQRAARNYGFTFSADMTSCSLEYENGVPNTYKFLGMDIDRDYRAVIPVGDGYVIVAEMFDAEKIIGMDPYELRRFDPKDKTGADNILKTCSSRIIRKVSTAMKTGMLYDIYKQASDKGNDLEISDFLPFINMVKDDIQFDGKSAEEALAFQSIILNLIHEAVKRSEEVTGISGDSEYSNIAVVILVKCFSYWKSVVEKYNGIHDILSEVDLWQSTYKKFIGDDEFNRRIKNSINIISGTTGEILNGVASVSGVARNGDLNDANTFRVSASSTLDTLSTIVTGQAYRVDPEDLTDILFGNIDYEKFDNPYDLTQEEVQAVSNYDSLQHVDEDAKVCMGSYNMDDPEERGLFMRSAIKSYERNFKEYKPSNNYDVTEAMADLIENGERFKDRIVPENSYDGEDQSVYVVTATDNEVKLNLNKQALLRVSKLIDKQLAPIEKMF